MNQLNKEDVIYCDEHLLSYDMSIWNFYLFQVQF